MVQHIINQFHVCVVKTLVLCLCSLYQFIKPLMLTLKIETVSYHFL